ncbi:MAG: N-acetylmuramoyl-L-alanine amidase [Mediterranea massiliensis]|nr:N-acetylmuramoyl-L-alanine amidase [Mediterranea massiliensis]
MKLLKFTTLSIALMLCGSLQAEIPLKITRGQQDTVYNKKHYIVAVTKAGKSVTINGTPTKVYKSGAFGTQLTLNEGNNSIEIRIKDGNEERIERFNVFYSAQTPAGERYSLSEASALIEQNRLKKLKFNAISQEGAYLQYGDGSDRLGGSKMGFIDKDITFKVIGEIGDLYKVQLSSNRFAFMPKEYLLPTDKEIQCINTGSWRVVNAGDFDRVSITLPQRLPYYSWMQLDPTILCIELYGAMNNSNWITQKEGLKMIDYVDFRQVESDVYQVIIKLQKQYAWGYEIGYEGNNLIIKVKHTPSLFLKDMIIGLDAGHGGEYSGAVSATGLTEKEVNLQLVNEVKAMLESKGSKVVLSRDADFDISMKDRKKIFKENNVDLMLSIHNNAGGSPLEPMGTSTYYKHICNRPLAATLLNRLLELGMPNYGLTGNFNFSLNAPTEYPNALLEILFMSSLPDEELLLDANYRKKIARQIVLGLEDYLKTVRESEK